MSKARTNAAVVAALLTLGGGLVTAMPASAHGGHDDKSAKPTKPADPPPPDSEPAEPAEPTPAGPTAITVTGVDYGYEAELDGLKTGDYKLTFKNGAKSEEHEMVLFKFKPETTESLSELLALPEEEGEKKVDFVGVLGAKAGETNPMSFEGTLAAGRWAIVCFIGEGGAEDGAPHFTKGMQREFKVE